MLKDPEFEKIVDKVIDGLKVPHTLCDLFWSEFDVDDRRTEDRRRV